MVKNAPAMWVDLVQSLGWEDPLEEGMATHSPVFLPGESPWTGYSPWGHKELATTEYTQTHTPETKTVS